MAILSLCSVIHQKDDTQLHNAWLAIMAQTTARDYSSSEIQVSYKVDAEGILR
jgi:hypothetical protein